MVKNYKNYKVKELIFENMVPVLKQEIKISESFMTLMLNIARKNTITDEIVDIIKVDLPENEKQALEILNNGFEFQNERYVYFATSAGLMKKAENEEEYEGECFFIKDSFKQFKKAFEDAISLGKLIEKKNTELSISKDVISRISLALSDGEFVHLPNMKVLVLPEMEYEFVNNYLQFTQKEDKSLDLDKFELKEHNELSVKHMAMDGSGIAMPHIMNEIKTKLNFPYPLSWVGIRQIGLATKGLLVKFDFHRYLREEHNLKELIVEDFWGTHQNIFDYDVIMNSSMCKWAKWFKNYKEYEDLQKQSKYNKIRHLFEGMNIVKYNKEESKKYSEMNYQILANLNLGEKELERISFESEDIYKRVINKDIDVTKIMLGDIARTDIEELSSSTKLHQSLQLDDNFINCQSMYKVVGNMINKKINNLGGGKIYVNGSYKVMIKDIISYFDSIVYRKYKYDDEGNKFMFGRMSENGLKDNQNYVPGDVGNRVLGRSPLNSATELIKTELVDSNKLYNKYFSNLSNDIIFYPFTDFMMRQSGADEDTDTSIVIDNETIFDSVIEDIDDNGIKWQFRNQLDGIKPPKFIYDDPNTYEVIVRGRGNQIGSLSNSGIKISNLIQTMPYKIDNKYYKYEEIIKMGIEGLILKYNHKDEKEIKKMAIEQFYKLIEDGKIQKLNDDEIKEFTYKQFQQYKKYSYYTLILQQIAIDAPKVGINVNPTQKNKLKECMDKSIKKPLFVYYAKYKTQNKQVKYEECCYSNSLLNNHAKRINKLYGAKAREHEYSTYDNHAFKNLFNRVETKVKNENISIDDKLFTLLTDLNNEYHYLRDDISVKSEIEKLREKLKKLRENEKENELFIYEILDKLAPLYKIRNEEYDLIDIKIQDKYDTHIKNKYSDMEILYTLGKIRSEKRDERGNRYRISSRFCIEFCFEEISKYLRNEKDNVVSAYELDKNGEVHYLFENYKKIDKSLDNKNLTKEQILKKEIKLGIIEKLRFKFTTDCRALNEEIVVQDNRIFNENGQALGGLYPDFENKLSNSVYKIRDYKIDKSGMGATIHVKIA